LGITKCDRLWKHVGMLQTRTNLYRRCHLQVSWWRVPYNTDRFRPPNHPMSHPWSLQGSCLVVVDTVCNRSWLGFLNLGHLQPHDVLLNNGKSIGCLCRHHGIHQLKQRQLEAGDIAARLVRRSPYKYDDTMNLNLYEQHFSYIKDLRSYSHSYLCSKSTMYC
jgi:hypothetical protein